MNEHRSLSAVYSDPTFPEYGKPCDALLKTDDGTKFQVYKHILSSQSKFFDALFSFDEGNEEGTVILGIKPDIFELVLIYLCTGHIDMNTDNMVDLLVASDSLTIEPLFRECRVFVLKNITLKNCFGLFVMGYQNKRLGIEYQCRRFVLRCFEKVLQHSGNDVFDLPYEALEYFLSSRSINVYGEHTIWSIIEVWVLKDTLNRMPLVPKLLRFLSVQEINDDLALNIIKSPIIRKNELYKDLEDPRVTFPTLSDEYRAQIIINFRNEPPFFLGGRLPSSLHFVTKRSLRGSIEMFISYDDELDVWRKLGEVYFNHPKILRVGHRLYIFETNRYRGREIYKGVIYDLIKNEIKSMASLGHPRFVVEASGHIYSLKDGYYDGVLQYVDETDEWVHIKPLQPMEIEGAVSFNGFLYTIGERGKTMVMQVYDPSLDIWKEMSPPNIQRVSMTAVVHQEKIFLIGGAYFDEDENFKVSRAVEVYDLVLDKWEPYPELPFEYALFTLSALVVVTKEGQEHLYVCDSSSMVYWDEEWIMDKDYHLPSLDRFLYFSCPIEGESVVREVMKRNKAAASTVWIETGVEKELLLKSCD